MKLLLDENLSRRIIPFIQVTYPGSTQVVLAGLEQADDVELWEYAQRQGFVIVTHDADFYELSLLRGQPPKIIWLKTGNQSKAALVKLLLTHQESIEHALLTEDRACVEIYL
jgi:predicted nuclease of predicted toxin-antitoxin system